MMWYGVNPRHPNMKRAVALSLVCCLASITAKLSVSRSSEFFFKEQHTPKIPETNKSESSSNFDCQVVNWLQTGFQAYLYIWLKTTQGQCVESSAKKNLCTHEGSTVDRNPLVDCSEITENHRNLVNNSWTITKEGLYNLLGIGETCAPRSPPPKHSSDLMVRLLFAMFGSNSKK